MLEINHERIDRSHIIPEDIKWSADYGIGPASEVPGSSAQARGPAAFDHKFHLRLRGCKSNLKVLKFLQEPDQISHMGAPIVATEQMVKVFSDIAFQALSGMDTALPVFSERLGKNVLPFGGQFRDLFAGPIG